MAWTRLTNSTTADADEVHANFAEVRSTSLLPMKLSTNASTTDGAYDIGSATKRWKSGHFSGTISCDDIKATTNAVPRLIGSYTHNGSTLNAFVTITVDSTQFRFLMLEGSFVKPTAAAGFANAAIVVNEISGSAYAARVWGSFWSNTALWTAQSGQATGLLGMDSGTPGTTTANRLSVSLKIQQVAIDGDYRCYWSGHIDAYCAVSQSAFWNATGNVTMSSATITSIQILHAAQIVTGSSVYVYGF